MYMACQDYFNHFEQSQSHGVAKTGEPQGKTPDLPHAEFGLSYLSHVMRKPILAICDQQRCRSACASAWLETPKTGFLMTWLIRTFMVVILKGFQVVSGISLHIINVLTQ